MNQLYLTKTILFNKGWSSTNGLMDNLTYNQKVVDFTLTYITKKTILLDLLFGKRPICGYAPLLILLFTAQHLEI